MVDPDVTPVLMFFAGSASVSFAILLLMLRDTRRRFSVRWMLVLVTFVALSLGMMTGLVHFLRELP